MELSLDVAGDDGMFEPGETDGNGLSTENYIHHVDEMFSKVDLLEQKVREIEQFYVNANKKQGATPKGFSGMKDKEKQSGGFKRRIHDSARRESAANKRMQELIRQFGKLIHQITQHKWAPPFMEPVDVVGLKLDDYYKVIEKPMDFGTIKNKMEAKDGDGYKHVREICADVRLIFKNAMKYNDENDDVHVMAKTLLGKFEEKWLQLLPKVDEEEKRRKEEEAEAHLDIHLSEEVAHAKMAQELSTELDEVDMQLDEFREIVLQNCRKMSTEEKRQLGSYFTRLSHEDLNKALSIVVESNPNFQMSDDEIDLDMDVQSESTLWKLKIFVKDALQATARKNSGGAAAGFGARNTNTNSTIANHHQNMNNKRRREICLALGDTPQKKSRKDL